MGKSRLAGSLISTTRAVNAKLFSTAIASQSIRATFLVLSSGLVTTPVHAVTTFTESGLSVKGTAVSFSADFAIVGDTLTLTLNNTSTTSSANPDDLLSSFYFDILNGGNRPTLTYASATGDTYINNALQVAGQDLTSVTLPPPPPSGSPDAWVIDTMDATQSPFMGFGIGTVGNNNLTPNNFQGSLVNGIDLSIYAGTITTANLQSNLLVKDTATFVFSGLTGFTEADVSDVVFGLGTAPDSLLPEIPLPPAVWLFGSGLLGLIGIARRKKAA